MSSTTRSTLARIDASRTARRWIHSGFVDLEVPLLGDKWSWPGARSLQLSVQERYDDYSTFGSAAKPKFALSYKPINDLTLRASYDEGFAAPSLANFSVHRLVLKLK